MPHFSYHISIRRHEGHLTPPANLPPRGHLLCDTFSLILNNVRQMVGISPTRATPVLQLCFEGFRQQERSALPRSQGS
ncbi:hypothetical protein E2C01_077681 [Portunus trituberculatus]|uniref:Uncharacterized protein n=1 Tax=Portunus trituberculatus TaxID=210409 RepID=A0A5B7IGM6_PORTR|nr:hypothetical protein [Portunus trituberculatus]